MFFIKKGLWEYIKEPEYVPFETLEELKENLMGKWVVRKGSGSAWLILGIYELSPERISIWLHGGTESPKSIFGSYEMPDGSPVGKLKEN